MSRFNESRRIGLCLLPFFLIGTVIGTMTGTAQAGESVSAASIRSMAVAEPVAAKLRDPAVVSALPKPGRGRQTLRCWQEGKLVFESSSVLPGTPAAVAIELRSPARGDVAVQVFDLKQGLCVIEYGGEP